MGDWVGRLCLVNAVTVEVKSAKNHMMYDYPTQDLASLNSWTLRPQRPNALHNRTGLNVVRREESDARFHRTHQQERICISKTASRDTPRWEATTTPAMPVNALSTGNRSPF